MEPVAFSSGRRGFASNEYSGVPLGKRQGAQAGLSGQAIREAPDRRV